MSKRTRKSVVISARLYEDDPNEATALSVHQKWNKNGYSTNEIITRSLLALDEQPMPDKPDRLASRLQDIIRELQGIISRVGQGGIVAAAPPSEAAPGVTIDQSLIDSLKGRANPGRRIEAE